MMKPCTERLSLSALLSRPAVELRLVGAEDEDDKGSENQSKDSEGTGKDGDKPNESGDGKDGDKPKEKPKADPKDKRIAQLEEERDRHYDLRRKAESDLKDAQTEIADLKKNGTTDEATKQELARLTAENAKLTGTVREQAVQVAFLQDNTFEWKNPKAALRLADLTKVEIDDKTGTAMGLSAALSALAESDPWMLKEKEVDSDDKTGDKKDDKKPAKTGTPPAQKQSQDEKSKQAEISKFRSKYSGLRR